ncbi:MULTISPECIES: NF038130 family PEP-CTERM protein [unclassified Nodularia (in: cyanobacteria)]|uniref:NF038130 family PEP-CTERM protein n=1 Tax=unclassified Nodularia (in: cyanobacteria) TaxID=2656917 RepID=UPI001882174E|nr:MULTISPECIES: NF038130 family PEP-CTERM protein [unclassified Nodularia (in: cyanobacteria)]MBE9200163.1 NF038130 family PEP-CTERM protein [Nodularia sp. LEGE 06071]MCC2694557.1 NF038130 family PEP-CTERM protein [Nodularia sp. LEGE 04288]
MKKTFSSLMIGTAMTVGLGAIATTSAQAATLTNVTIGGTSPTDYFVYDSNATNTFLVPSTLENVQKVLDNASAANPTGNVELAASSEQPGFDFTKNTTLEGTINGKTLILSSLVESDWTSLYKDTGLTFGEFWFSEALSANGFANLVGTPTGQALFANFVDNGGYQRFSDPNIAYVTQDDANSPIKIGLAGVLNARDLLFSTVPPQFQPLLDQVSTIQVSEIYKFTYEGQSDFQYSFSAVPSGLVTLDGTMSHDGIYDPFIFPNVPPTSIPEPSVILGMLGVAGIFATQRKLKKVSS